MTPDPPKLREPGRRAKCRNKAVNKPGFLIVESYLRCAAGACTVNGSGDMHHVELRNDSPLRYQIDVEGRCVTGGIAFVHGDDRPSSWAERVEIPGRGRRGGPTVTIDRQLVAVRERNDEIIDVWVSWAVCAPEIGSGRFGRPLSIQVDAQPPGE